jgi:ureidoacrylate peracid hydrolase
MTFARPPENGGTMTTEGIPAATRTRAVLRATADIVDPGHTALLVVDVQNDFCHRDGGLARGGGDMSDIEKAIERLADVISAARSAGVPVVFLRIIQSPATNSDAWESLEPETGERLVVEGTWGADYYGPIRPEPGDQEIVKHRHSGFVGTRLDLLLRSMGVRSVVLGGVASNVCVEATARDAADYDYYVTVLSDASGAVRDELHQASLYTIRTYIGRTLDSDYLTGIWARATS